MEGRGPRGIKHPWKHRRRHQRHKTSEQMRRNEQTRGHSRMDFHRTALLRTRGQLWKQTDRQSSDEVQSCVHIWVMTISTHEGQLLQGKCSEVILKPGFSFCQLTLPPAWTGRHTQPEQTPARWTTLSSTSFSPRQKNQLV